MNINQKLAQFQSLDLNSIPNPELREKAKTLKAKQGGFTLLELLVVIAILATIAGGLLVSYDGLDGKAEKGQATFNLGAIDKGVRAFKVVTGAYPDNLDNLVDDAAPPAAVFTLPSNLQRKLSTHTLDANGLASLQAVGINTVRFIPNASNTAATVGALGIPNRAFDDAPRGLGASLTLAVGSAVSVIESDQSTDLLGGANTNSNRLKDIAGLDATIPHLVVALGIGNNSTIVSNDTGRNAANFSQAPTYTSVDKDEYGRFVALYHIASDNGAGGGVADDNTYTQGEYFSEARFIGVVDTFGDWQDEEYAEFTGQKN